MKVEKNDQTWRSGNTSHVSPGDQSNLDTSRYNLTIEEASVQFAEAGVPRSPRTITRFCALGDLECIRVDTEKNFKWLIDPSSLAKRIKELQQALHFSKKTYLDISGHVLPNNETRPDMSRHDDHLQFQEQEGEGKEYLNMRVEELENELMHARIDKAAKEQVINQLASERREYIEQMKEMSFQLGEARTMLQLQAAPKPEPATSHVSTPDEARPAEPEVPPIAPAPEPKKGGLFKWMKR